VVADRRIEEDVLLDGAAALSAVFLGPADPQPAVLAEALEAAGVLRRLARSAALRLDLQLGSQLGGDQIRQVDVDLPLEPLLLGAQVEVHRGCNYQ
jgi:hypothetical protein